MRAADQKTSLEAAIQSHVAQIDQLRDEMCYLRAVNMELRRRVRLHLFIISVY